MKKYIIKLFVFLLLVGMADYFCGVMCNFLVNHSRSGGTACITGILNKNICDVLIMGSSRCVCHYDDKLIGDSLGVKVTNIGQKGNGIILMYGYYKLIPKEHRPRVLIYDVEPSFDIIEYKKDDNNKRYLAGLKIFYDFEEIKDVFFKVNPTEIFKMYSNLYRYNSMCFSLFQDYIRSCEIKYSYYMPSHKEYSSITTTPPKTKVDSQKLFFFEQLIKDTKDDGIQLVVVASPKYGATSIQDILPIMDLCRKYNVPLWDYYLDMHNTKWFCDNMHLNYEGSQLFSKTIFKRLKEEIFADN